MPYPLSTPLGRFGIEPLEESPQRCAASIPAGGMLNPLTGAPTVAPLAMLVDHVGGVINHHRRGDREWTVSSELSLELSPDAAEVIASRPGVPVVGVSRPIGRKDNAALGLCELSVDANVVATATVRSFYITAPDDLAAWPDGPSGSLPGSTLAELMAVHVGESGAAATVLMQRADPVLNNSVGVVHGGVASMGLELVGSAAIDDGSGAGFRTAALRVNFLRPFHGGGEAHYHAKPLHVGRSTGVAETQAVCRDGRVAILARLTAYR